jgi:AcrR family transcriptional regulator
MVALSQKQARYQSPLRAQQAQDTRERIIRAFAEHIVEHGLHAFSIAQIAARAGVAEPTVYRHFPNREALVAGARELAHAKLGERLLLPEHLDDFAQAAEAGFRRFNDNAELVRAAVRVGVARREQESGRKRRDATLMGAYESELTHLPPAEARAFRAVLRTLVSSDAWDTMTGRLQCDPEVIPRVIAWAVDALTDAMRRDRAKGLETLAPRRRKQRKGEGTK